MQMGQRGPVCALRCGPRTNSARAEIVNAVCAADGVAYIHASHEERGVAW